MFRNPALKRQKEEIYYDQTLILLKRLSLALLYYQETMTEEGTVCLNKHTRKMSAGIT